MPCLREEWGRLERIERKTNDEEGRMNGIHGEVLMWALGTDSTKRPFLTLLLLRQRGGGGGEYESRKRRGGEEEKIVGERG